MQQYAEEVEKGVFPGPEHVFTIKDDVYQALVEDVEKRGL